LACNKVMARNLKKVSPAATLNLFLKCHKSEKLEKERDMPCKDFFLKIILQLGTFRYLPLKKLELLKDRSKVC